MNLGIMASGNGSNAQAIIDAVQAGNLSAKITCIVSDNPSAHVIKRAELAGIPACVFQPKLFENRHDWELAMIDYFKKQEVDFIILAGFMRIVGQPLLKAFPNRIINIHPALLPAFPGRNGIKDAYEAGVTQTGVTVHFVDEGIDTGEIIAQQAIMIDPEWTLADLEKKIHQVEHQLYPQTIAHLLKTFVA